jgi:hypothetical protein
MFRGDEEVPNYMLAVDTHQVANGRASVLESPVDEGIDFGKFALSATARAVTSTFNIIPAVARWVGSDMEDVQTEEVLRSFDDDLGAYYSANRDTVDIVGDVVSMFVPGMAGVKGINYAQKGIAAIAKGENVGSRIAHSFGTLPNLGSKYANEAALKIAETGNTFRVLEGNTLKAFAANYGQAAIEMAAFEVAAAATMENSPLFENHTASDIFKNALYGGGLIGGGIMGSVAAAQTYTGVKKFSQQVGELLNPYRRIEGTEQGTGEWVRLLELRKQKYNTPDIGEGIDPALSAEKQLSIKNLQVRSLEKRQQDIENETQKLLTTLSGGDAEIASSLRKNLDQWDHDSAVKNLVDLNGVSRLGNIHKLEIEAAKTKDGLENLVIKYVDLVDGTVSHTTPRAIGLVDSVVGKAELLRDVERRMSSQPPVGRDYSVVGKNHQDVEARYIHAEQQIKGMDVRDSIGGRDLPFLDAAVNSGRSATVDGVLMDNATLREYVKKVKLQEADNLADYLAVDPTMNEEIAAKLLNVDEKILAGTKGYKQDADSHFWAQTEMSLEPRHLKVFYNPREPELDVVSGMVRAKQAQIAQAQTNAQAVAHVLEGDAEKVLSIKIRDDQVLAASPHGAGASAVAAASADYGTLGSTVEYIGKVTNSLISGVRKKASDTLTPVMHAVLQNKAAQNELAVIRQAVLSTGEHYVLSDGKLVLKSVRDYDAAILAGKKVPEPTIPEGVLPEIEIKSKEAWDYLVEATELNSSYLNKEKMLRNAQGKGIGSYEGVVYFPQPSSKNYPYFSFVKPKSAFEGEKTSMIWARTPEELQTLEAKVPAEYRLVRKSDADEFYKVRKEYDSDRGMNSRDVDSDLRRRGVAAPFIPETNVQEMFTEVLEHYGDKFSQQIRDTVSLHHNVAFQELRSMDAYTKAAQTSKKPGAGDKTGVTPYESYIKTALDIPRSSYLPAWTELNNLAENVITKVANSVKGTFGKPKSDADIEAINKAFDDAGFRGVKDSLTEMVANHPADKRVLSKWVQNANALFSTLVLRTDPMNALNNGFGNTILLGSETASLTRMIAGNKEGAAFLRELGEVKLPGSEAYIRSPSKLIASAYQDFFSFIRKDPEAVAKFETYEKNGWMPSHMDQLRQSFDAMTLTGKETTGELSAKIAAAGKSTGDFLEKWSGNKFAEQMNRFVSATVADKISTAGMKYAGLSQSDALAFVNTFVNRTQGNYVASQRPLMFQGALGQSISLFMTYQFNMLQHIFRHVGQGDKAQTAILMGLQSSMYGFNGLPAFQFMNQHLVANASGNRNHTDAFSTLSQVPAVGDFLLYGGLSNATGLGLYSRGDLNPRHLTVVPTNMEDIPFVSGTTKFLGALGQAVSETAAGANPASTFLRGIEHAGISRPLAGIAQALNGVLRDDDKILSTTSQGKIVYSQDLYSLATLGRMAGARPYDEAVTRDAMFRAQSYDAAYHKKANTIGAAIRDRVNSDTPITQEDYDNFMGKYVAAGGDHKNFVKFYQQRVKEAGKSAVSSLLEKSSSPSGRYMQNMMRGIDSDITGMEQ